MDKIHHVKEIIGHKIIIGEIFLPPKGKYGVVIRAQVKARADQFDRYQEMFLVNVGEGQATNIMIYNAIIKGLYMKLQSDSELEDKG